VVTRIQRGLTVRGAADKSLAFPGCSTSKRVFLGWVKEVRTTKSLSGARGICKVNIFFNSVACFLYKAEDLSAAPHMTDCQAPRKNCQGCLGVNAVALKNPIAVP
jgi:hypothetical protein